MNVDVIDRFEGLKVGRPHLQLYALVDGLRHEQVFGAPVAAEPGQVALFDGTPDAALSAAGPWLVAASEHTVQRDRLMAHPGQTSCVSWLFSEVPLSGLAQLLQLRLDARLPSGGIALLRFYDPRVLRGLARTLTPEQREAFFAHIHEWHFVVDGQASWIGRHDA